MEIGSLSDLLSAIGSLTAVVAASIAARAAIQTNNQQSTQLRYLEGSEQRQREEREREQASKVAAWMALGMEDYLDLPVCVWANSSGLPLYDITFYVALPNKLVRTKYSALGPTSTTDLPRVHRAIMRDAPVGADKMTWVKLLDLRALRAAISFRDVFDNIWLRNFSGELIKHSTMAAAERDAERCYELLIGRLKSSVDNDNA